MFFKYFDLLSPPITFYYNGSNSHLSITSGILNIISYILIIAYSTYFLIIIAQRKNPKIFYSNFLYEDAGVFYFNSSSLFHFVTIEQKGRKTIRNGFDFLKFRLIGFDRGYESYIYSGLLLKFDHWLYGKCKDQNYTKNITGVNDHDYFGESACISKFYNNKEKKYYDVGELGFKWPKLAHGLNNKDNSFYNILVSKCQKETLNLTIGDNYECDNETEFENFFDVKTPKTFGIYLKDNYVNISNYKSPLSAYYTKLENTIDYKYYNTKNIIFNPTIVQTNDGFIFDNIFDNLTYILEGENTFLSERKDYDIYFGIKFYLKNKGYYFERNYERVADILSAVGGVYTAINLVFYFLNLYINRYIVLKDMKNLLDSPIDIKRNYIINLNNTKIEDNKSNNSDNTIVTIKSGSSRKSFVKFDLGDKKQKIYYNTDNNSSTTSNENNFIDKSDDFKTWDIQKRKSIENKNIEEFINKNLKKDKSFSFCNYFVYKITFGKKRENFSIYDKFRTKILSEESLLKNYLSIFNLLKVTKNKNMDFFLKRTNSKLSDLINEY